MELTKIKLSRINLIFIIGFIILGLFTTFKEINAQAIEGTGTYDDNHIVTLTVPGYTNANGDNPWVRTYKNTFPETSNQVYVNNTYNNITFDSLDNGFLTVNYRFLGNTNAVIDTYTNYWTLFNLSGGSGTSTYAYFKWWYDGTDIHNGDLDIPTITRINWISPSTSTASTTYNIELEYYLNSSTHDPNIYSDILIQICPINFDGECTKTSINATNTNQYVSRTIPITNSPITFVLGTANFWNGVEENTECSWWELWCDEETLIIGKGTSKRFNVATTTYDIWEVMNISKKGIIESCEEDSNFATEALCRTLIWLFYPEDNTADTLLNLANQLNNKIPFGYVNLINEKVNSISATSSPWNSYAMKIGTSTDQFRLGTIEAFNFTHAKETIGEEHLNTITTWIINIIWILFGVYIIMRVIKITSKI